jgi:Holliday junction resolvase
MAKTPEGKVKERAVRQLAQMGVYYFHPVTGGFGASGQPDIVGCTDSTFFGIECKAGKNKPTALQLSNLKRIKANGGIALIINEDNVDALTTYLLTKTSNVE